MGFQVGITIDKDASSGNYSVTIDTTKENIQNEHIQFYLLGVNVQRMLFNIFDYNPLYVKVIECGGETISVSKDFHQIILPRLSQQITLSWDYITQSEVVEETYNNLEPNLKFPYFSSTDGNCGL